MADTKKEHKDYISIMEADGEVRISEDVVVSIAAAAANDVPGVSVAQGGIVGEIANLLGRKNLGKTIRMQTTDNAVSIDMVVTIAFGVHIQQTTVKVQETVSEAIEAMCGLKVAAVNIQVAGVTFEKEKAEPAAQMPQE